VSRRLGPDGIAARDCGLRRVLTRSQRTTGLSGALKVSRQLSRLFDSWEFCEWPARAARHTLRDARERTVRRRYAPAPVRLPRPRPDGAASAHPRRLTPRRSPHPRTAQI